MNWRFVCFLFSVATFVLNLPELASKFGKYLPILVYVDGSIKSGIRMAVALLPLTPPSGKMLDWVIFWPDLALSVVGVAIIAAAALASIYYLRRKQFTELKWLGVLVVMWFLLSFVSEVRLLQETSTMGFWQILLDVIYSGTWRSLYEKSNDKAYFYYGAVIYQFIILIVSIFLYLLVSALWVIFKKTEQKPGRATRLLLRTRSSSCAQPSGVGRRPDAPFDLLSGTRGRSLLD